MKEYAVSYSETLDLADGVVLSDFVSPWVDRTIPRTAFRAVWNKENFRFQFDVDDDDLVLDQSDEAEKAALGSDRVELFFASDETLTEPYYALAMAPRGNVCDYIATTYRQIDWGWDFPSLQLETAIGEAGYTVEGTLTLEVLRDLNCLVDQRIRTGVYRAEFSRGADGVVQDWLTWIDPGTEAPDFHVPTSFGTFHLVAG